jgi:ligand-binding sensor protein
MNKITAAKSLHIETLYSFQSVSNEKWVDEFKILQDFARKTECKTVTFDTRSNKVMELGKLIGFVEKRRSFELNIGGV